MYNDEVTRAPKDEDELWELLREQFEFVRDVLQNLPAETREEALENAADTKRSRTNLTVVRYRGTSEELDNRDYYLEMGRTLLPYIKGAIKRRKLTPRFVQQWGKVMFCHGYVASYVLDDSDDLAHARAGFKTGKLRSKASQRKWIAHLMISLVDSGWSDLLGFPNSCSPFRRRASCFEHSKDATA